MKMADATPLTLVEMDMVVRKALVSSRSNDLMTLSRRTITSGLSYEAPGSIRTVERTA